MKRNFFNRIGGALAAAVAVAGLLFGCSDIAGTGDEGGSASKGSAAASVFIPDYDTLAQQVSGARAVAPQTATVRLSSAASPAAFSAVSQALSAGEKTEGTNAAGVAGYSYKFTFRIPVGEYAAGSLKVETLGSDGSTLTSGVSASAVTVKAGADAATSFTLVPAAAEASYSGALGAGEMQFITVTVPASSAYEVTATEGVTLFLFDASGKYSSTLTGTEIENSTEAAVTYYIGIYNAGTSAIESCSVTASAAVKSVDVTWDWVAKGVTQSSDGTTYGTDAITSGYLKGDSDTIVTAVSGGQFKITTGDNPYGQMNNGATIKVPVSSGSVVTVLAWDSNAAKNLYLGGTVLTDILDEGSTNSASYTATKAGYITLKSAADSTYIRSLKVTGLNASDDFTKDVVDFAAGTAEVTNDSSTLGLTATSVSSSDENVATATVADGKITITAVAAGSATITAKDSDSHEATIAVTVGDYGAVTVGTITPYTASLPETYYIKYNWESATDGGTRATTATVDSTTYVIGAAYSDEDFSKALSMDSSYVQAATTGSWNIDNSTYVQPNADASILIPVSKGSVVTISFWDKNAAEKFSLAGSTVTSSDLTLNLSNKNGNGMSYTAVATGYVELKCTASYYVRYITVSGVATADVNSHTTSAVPTLSSIEVATAPTTTSYSAGSSIDLTGLVLSLTYSDGSTSSVTYSSSDADDYTVSGFSAATDKSGIDQTVTVTYGGVSATFKYNVTVTAAAYFSSLRFDDKAFEDALGSTPTANDTTTIAKNTEVSAKDGTWTILATSKGATYIQDGTKAITGGSYSTYDYDESAKTGKKYTRLFDTNGKASTIKLKTGTDTVYLRIDAAPQTSGTAGSFTFTGATTATWTPSYSGTKFIEIAGDTDGYVTVTTTTARVYIYGIYAVSSTDVVDTSKVTSSTNLTDAVYNNPTVTVAKSFTQGDTITASAEVVAPTVSTSTTVYADGTASTTSGTEAVDTSTIVWKLGDTELGTGASLSYATSSTSGESNFIAAATYSLTASYTAGETTYTSTEEEVTIIAYGTTTYTVKFDSKGGSTVDSQKIASGGKASKPDNPTYSGYTFGGWYTSTDNGTTLSDSAYKFDSEVTADITLYAKWTKITSETVGYLNSWTMTTSPIPDTVKDSSNNEILTFYGWKGNLQTLKTALTGTDIDGKSVSYTQGLSIGGKTSSKIFTKLVVPTGMTADVYVAFITGSNGSERGCGIGTSAGTTCDTVSLVQNSDTSSMSYMKTSASLSAGTYYINCDNNIRIYAIQVKLKK